MSIYKGTTLISGKGVITVDNSLSLSSENALQNKIITKELNDKMNKNGLPCISSNLLINPNFKINQRGSADYTSEGYTVDCWKLKKHPSVSTIGTVTVNDDYIALQGGGTRLDTYFLQPIENASEKLAGKTVTISFRVGGDVSIDWFVGQYGGTYTTLANTDLDENGVGQITLVWDGTQTVQAVTFFNNIESAELKVYWIKLEIGGTATPFIAPDYDRELLKCQRYYTKISTGRYTRATYIGTDTEFFLLPLPVVMAKVPTIKSGTIGVIPLNMSTESSVDTSFTITLAAFKGNNLTVSARKTGGAIDGALYIKKELILAVEL